MAKYIFISLILLFCNFPSNGVFADEIKMKDGTVHQGRITYEGDDIVKIEISISASIKETKILGRGDVAEVKKDARDDVEFAKLETLVPTEPLMTASGYQKALDTGPRAFLRSFPDSKHAEKAKAMEKTLLEELDKVERGFVKIEEDWVSPQEKKKFAAQVESRIRLHKMRTIAKSGNHNGFIAAMREFEALEQGYYGTPAFATAADLALQIIPALGRQLQTMQRDADYRQAQYEQNKANLDATSRAQVEQARVREEQAYQAGLELDKKAGIRWVRLNPSSKLSIISYLDFASKELKRVQEYDIKILTTQAEKFVKVDELIEDGSLKRAELLMKEASALTGKKPSKKSSRSKKASSYIAILSEKIRSKKTESIAIAKAMEEAAKSEAITKRMEKAENTSGLSIPEAQKGEKGESTIGSDAASDFAALSGAKKKKEAPAEEKAKSSKKGSSKESDSDKKREPVVSAPIDEGAGFPVGLIIPIITVLVIVGVVLLKVFGGKKDKDEVDEDEA
jgi:hypothetical protein